MNHTGLSNTDFIDCLKNIVGANNILIGEPDTAGYLEDWTGAFNGHALAIVRPESTKEVLELVNCCRSNKVSIVPQGGRTGLCGGGVPVAGSKAIVLSLLRMNSIRKLDTAGRTVVAEAGVVLESLQEAVAKKIYCFH